VVGLPVATWVVPVPNANPGAPYSMFQVPGTTVFASTQEISTLVVVALPDCTFEGGKQVGGI